MKQAHLDYAISQAEQGDAYRIFELFNYYVENKNLDEAYKWVKIGIDKIKDAKEVGTLQYLYSIYCRDMNDIDLMKTYLESAAKNGNECANLTIGNNYYEGKDGYEKDIFKALKHWLLSSFKDNKYAWKNVKFLLHELANGKYSQETISKLATYIDFNMNIFPKDTFKSNVVLYKLHQITKGKKEASNYLQKNLNIIKVITNELSSSTKNIFATDRLHNCNFTEEANEGSDASFSKKKMIFVLLSSLLAYWFFNQPTPEEQELNDLKIKQQVDIDDCTLTIGGHYKIRVMDPSVLISLTPKYGHYQHYFIEFFNESNRSKFMENHIEHSGYDRYKLTIDKNMAVCSVHSGIGGYDINTYIVFGKTFYIYFGHLNDNAKELIKSCNDTWKY